MTVEQDVQKFKIELLRKMPFYGDIVTRLPFEKNTKVSTACTDGMRIYYNPEFFEPMTQGERFFVLFHEVLHVLLMHCKRGKGYNAKIWNTACDIIVNQMLINMSGHMSAMDIPFKQPADGIYSKVSLEVPTEDLYEQIKALNKGKIGKKLTIKKNFIWGGSADHNMQNIEVMEDLDHSKSDMIDESLIKRMIKESMEKYRSDVGSYYIPNQLIQLTESKKLNWKTLLKSFLNQKISDEASYTTPERKYLHMDLILPGYSMTDEELDEIWAFIDSSGSVSEDELNQFLTQLYRISKEFHCETNICYWDTKVTDVYRNIRKEKEIFKCPPKHFGGTDINCVYDWISENKIKPDVMIIFTDGAFGRLNTSTFKKKYQKQTILVISNERFITEEMKRIGKIATL